MNRSKHRGIPILWDQGPQPLTGALVFGVGARDETYRTAQVTHAVEHLACSTVPKSHLEHNAFVSDDVTVFHATGRPEQVADYLRQIAMALRDLPLDRFERELTVLDAEESSPVHPGVGWSASVRFGASGPGLLGMDGAPVTQLRADMVTEHARRYFTTGNAVLVFTGPPPELDVTLPEGPRHQRDAEPVPTLTTPAAGTAEAPYALISYVMPAHEAGWLLPTILEERATDRLRQDLGISYSVDGDFMRLADGTLVVHVADGRPEHAQTVAQTLWEVLSDLAEQGPTSEELAHHVEGHRQSTQDPRGVMDHLVWAATRLLDDKPVLTGQEQTALAEQVAAEDVQAWARLAQASALIGLPEGVRIDLPGVADLDTMEQPSTPPVHGEVFGRKLTAVLAPLDLRAITGPAGVSLRAGGYTWSGTWDDVVAVARSTGDRGFVLRDGRTFSLCDRHLKNTARLFKLVDDHAGSKAYDVPDDDSH